MKKLSALFMTMLMCVCLMATCSAADNDVHTMTISGTGKAIAVPDVAVVTLGVTSYNKDAGVAQQDNARRASAVQAAVEELGIEAKDVRTRDYSFNPRYSSEKNKQNVIIGYSVNNSVVVTINDISKVSRVIDSALNNGATNVSSLSYSIKDAKALRNQALANAIADARSKAEIMAQGLGVRITGIKHVSESAGTVRPHNVRANFAAKNVALSDAVATPVSAGTLDVDANVHVDYIIQ